MSMQDGSRIPKNWSASVEMQVPFYDIDMMGIVWHGCYVKYFELARCELFNQLKYNYEQMRDSGFAWPIIDMHIRYAQPARFQQLLTIKATIVEFEYRLKLKYSITDSLTGKRLTKGHSIQVAVDLVTSEMCYQSPSILLEKLGVNRSIKGD